MIARGTDSEQSLVVCDNAGSLKVRRQDGKVETHRLPGRVGWVLDVLVVTDRLYVLWHDLSVGKCKLTVWKLNLQK